MPIKESLITTTALKQGRNVQPLKTNTRSADGLFVSELENALFDRSYNAGYYRQGSITDPRFRDPRTEALVESSSLLDREDSSIDFDQKDYIRHMMGSFWTHSQEYDKATLAMYSSRFPDSPYIRNIELLESYQDDQGKTTQEVKIEFLDAAARSQVLPEITEFLSQGRTLYDHATTFNVFEQGSNQREEQLGILNLYAEIKTEYNFLQKNYEENLSQKQEITLPNLYNFMLSEKTVAENQRLLTNGGRISISPQISLGSGNPISNYLDDFTKTYDDWIETSINSIQPMRNIVFTSEETNNLEELYLYKELFPMFTTIEFTTENDARFGTTLEGTDFSSQLRDYLSSPTARRNSSRIATAEVLFNRRESQRDTRLESTISEKTYYDVDDFFDEYQQVVGEVSTENIYFNTASGRNPLEHRAFFTLMSIITKGKMEKIRKQSTRNYVDVVEGEQAYNEVVFYKVAKFDDEGTLIQTFHFTNTESVDVVRFVDTQVKYDKNYTYKISSVSLVVGTKYKYMSSLFSVTSTGANFKIESEPSVKVVEIPLFEKKVVIRDNPPIAPELTVVPFSGVNNRLRFLLNSGIGRYSLEPITFTPEESEMIESYRVAQDIPSTQSEIMFETDDELTRFHFYKMDREPLSYLDFELMGEKIDIPTTNASSATYDDQIEPNKKYYYCARSVDYHSNLSYPSVVFEAELVDDSGSIYPVFKVHEFKEPRYKQPSRGVKRFIGISPSAKNLFVDERDMGLTENNGPLEGQEVSLGMGDGTTWGKKFKVRLTSKETGKKVDFNFTLRHKTEK